MPVVTEVRGWLDDLAKTGLSVEQIKTLEETLGANEKSQQYIKESQLRQSDYSSKFEKHNKELADKAAEIAAATDKLENDRVALVEWKLSADTNIVTKQREIEKLTTRIAKASSRIASLKESYAIADEDVKDLFEEGPVAIKVETKVDGNGSYVSREDFNKEAQTLVRTFPRLSLELDDIRDEHREIFGKRLPKDQAEAILEKAYNSGGKLSVRNVWEAECKVGDRRNEIQEAKITKRVKTEAEALYTKRMSEASLPGGRKPDGRTGSPVFNITRDTKTSTTHGPSASETYNQPGKTVQKAVQAYRERAAKTGQ